MTTPVETSYNVLNTFLAAGGSVILDGNTVRVTGAPAIDRSLIRGIISYPSNPEVLQDIDVSWTAGSNTVYNMVINQLIEPSVGGALPQRSQPVYIVSDATGTDAEIASALVNQINAYTSANKIAVTATGATTPIRLAGVTGQAPFSLAALGNLTQASGFTALGALNATPANAVYNTGGVLAPNGTPGTALAGTATVTITTNAAHGLQPGDRIRVTGMVGYTVNGLTLYEGYVATVPTSVTFTLTEAVGAGTNTGTIAIRALEATYLDFQAAHGLTSGEQVLVSGIAGYLVGGNTSFSGAVYVDGSLATTVAKVRGAAGNTIANTGVPALPLRVPSTSRGIGSVIVNDFVTNNTSAITISTTANYSVITVQLDSPNGQSQDGPLSVPTEHTFLFNEAGTNYNTNYSKLLYLLMYP